MNRKQTIVLWVVGTIISLASLVYGIDKNDPLTGFVVPVLLIGGLFIYQFRDRNKPSSGDTFKSSKLLSIILVFVVSQVGFLYTQHRMIHSIQGDVGRIEGDVSSIESDISQIQSDISEIESDISLLHFK